jgi:hypothetical protein
VQFIHAPLHEPVAIIYAVWFTAAAIWYIIRFLRTGVAPRALSVLLNRGAVSTK